MRTGLIGKKVGMTRVFATNGEHVPVTLVYVGSGCQVVASKTVEKDGYYALQLGFGNVRAGCLTKALRGHFQKAGVEPKKKIKEFRVGQEALLGAASVLGADHFSVGQFVDVSGISLGKGFAGPMKRHNFGGLRASHGVSVSHRSHGSTGNRTEPGRVFKGKKMAGRLGGERVTIQNLCIVKVDTDRGFLLIKGGLPGGTGGYLYIQDAVKLDGLCK